VRGEALANATRRPRRPPERLIDLGDRTITIDASLVTFRHADGRELISTRGDPP
jgi:hypothetical protein